MTTPKWDANPACLLCDDTGERTVMTPHGDHGFFYETQPCTCARGLALEAFAAARQMHTLTVPLGPEPTIEERNNG